MNNTLCKYLAANSRCLRSAIAATSLPRSVEFAEAMMDLQNLVEE
ncbi:MAG: hypothetical protein ABW049_00280 [Spongiibacteraceae bacterium]